MCQPWRNPLSSAFEVSTKVLDVGLIASSNRIYESDNNVAQGLKAGMESATHTKKAHKTFQIATLKFVSLSRYSMDDLRGFGPSFL